MIQPDNVPRVEVTMPDRTTSQIMDREYLELRAKILELAASFDRIERGEGTPDSRQQKIRQGLAALMDEESDKAKRIQMIFSREYSEDWRSSFGI